MQTIIKVNQKKIGNHKVNSVLASELYRKLEIKEDFSKWIKEKLKQINLIENSDYLTLIKNPNGKYLMKEYVLSIESAKHIAMMSDNPKSFEIRSYFIELEKKYQKKLLKNFKRYKNLLKNEQDKNIDLFAKLQKCKKNLKDCEKKQKFVKEDCLLEFQDISLKVQKSINDFKTIELIALNRNIPQSEILDYFDSLLESLDKYIQIKTQ